MKGGPERKKGRDLGRGEKKVGIGGKKKEKGALSLSLERETEKGRKEKPNSRVIS